jgi:hypothetical protein
MEYVMGRIPLKTPPSYEQACKEYRYVTRLQDEPRRIVASLHPIATDREYGGTIINDSVDLLALWPKTLSIAGQQWPFLKVVFLMANGRWPIGPIHYPLPPCKPDNIMEWSTRRNDSDDDLNAT